MPEPPPASSIAPAASPATATTTAAVAAAPASPALSTEPSPSPPFAAPPAATIDSTRPTPPSSSAAAAAAAEFFTSLLGKTLRVRIADGRLFRGEMRCTDRERNIILSNTLEFRLPTERQVREMKEKLDRGKNKAKQEHDEDDAERVVGEAAVSNQSVSDDEVVEEEEKEEEEDEDEELEVYKKALNATGRFVGLVVMPGKDVQMVEVEEFDASSMKAKAAAG